MAEHTEKQKTRTLHSAEVFEGEIQDLERAHMRSWSTWVAALGGLALLVGIALVIVAYETSTYRGHAVIGNIAPVVLREPKGTLDHLPTSFRWEAVSGAESYLVAVLRADTDAEQVVLLRPSRSPSIAPTAQDLAAFRSGAYRWTVEARGEDGKTRAWGEGEFTLRVEGH